MAFYDTREVSGRQRAEERERERASLAVIVKLVERARSPRSTINYAETNLTDPFLP